MEINKTCSLPQVEERSEGGPEIYTAIVKSYSSGQLTDVTRIYGRPQPFSPEDSIVVAFPSEVESLLKVFRTFVAV